MKFVIYTVSGELKEFPIANVSEMGFVPEYSGDSITAAGLQVNTDLASVAGITVVSVDPDPEPPLANQDTGDGSQLGDGD